MSMEDVLKDPATRKQAEEVMARFEELNILESQFEDAEIQVVRATNAIYEPLWKKRAELIAKIPHFWTLVFEEAPPELDNFIQPSDAQVFAECLKTFEVSRFEMNDPKGSPHSVSIKFGFDENKYFTDKEIEKRFWYRKSKDWVGLVSEPVKINWKKGQDLTGGLNNAAYDLAQARKKLPKDSEGKTNAKEEANLLEYKALAKKIEESTEASSSFFAWFSFVSSWRWISAEESAKAEKDEAAQLEKLKLGERPEEEEEKENNDEFDDMDYQETEVFPQGDEIATLLADDIWPSAIRYYKQTHDETDDEELSDLEVSDMEGMDDSDDEIVDIRGLVGKGRKSSGSGPPAKKQRQA